MSPVTVENKALAERVHLLESLDAEAERVHLLESLDADERNAVLKIIGGLLTKKKLFNVVLKEAQPTAC